VEIIEEGAVLGVNVGHPIVTSGEFVAKITMPEPHCSVVYSLDALTVAQPTMSKH